jgi:F-type H+-transporting ATPase subunit gamma
MEAVAASSIGKYEKSVLALELGLGACFRESGPVPLIAERKKQTVEGLIRAVVFGSDQGLVGQKVPVIPDARP